MKEKQNDKADSGIKNPSSEELTHLALYLEGLYKGRGNLYPLGKMCLENLWLTIKNLQRQGL